MASPKIEWLANKPLADRMLKIKNSCRHDKDKKGCEPEAGFGNESGFAEALAGLLRGLHVVTVTSSLKVGKHCLSRLLFKLMHYRPFEPIQREAISASYNSLETSPVTMPLRSQESGNGLARHFRASVP